MELDHGFFFLSYLGVFAETERDRLCSRAPKIPDATTRAPKSVRSTQCPVFSERTGSRRRRKHRTQTCVTAATLLLFCWGHRDLLNVCRRQQLILCTRASLLLQSPCDQEAHKRAKLFKRTPRWRHHRLFSKNKCFVDLPPPAEARAASALRQRLGYRPPLTFRSLPWRNTRREWLNTPPVRQAQRPSESRHHMVPTAHHLTFLLLDPSRLNSLVRRKDLQVF